MLKALLLDLDNTIYPVHQIGDRLFEELFKLIEDSGEVDDMRDIKKEIMRKPFQVVAREFGLSEDLAKSGINLLRDLEYRGPISAFRDFSVVQGINADKFLVTTGFVKLQESKITGMGIREVFREIHIVDPLTSVHTKKDVFADILNRYGYTKQEVLVVGDDPQSEIKAALELDLPVVMYDALGLHANESSLRRITHYAELHGIINALY